MDNPTCRSCDRSADADADAYCSSCVANIMAETLSLSSADIGSNFLLDKGHLHHYQDPPSTTQAINSTCSNSPGTSYTWCKDNEENRHLLDLRPQLLGVAGQGAEFLIRNLPRATSPVRVQIQGEDLTHTTQGRWLRSFALEDLSITSGPSGSGSGTSLREVPPVASPIRFQKAQSFEITGLLR